VRAAEKASAQARARLASALEPLGLEVLPGAQGPYLLCEAVPAVREGLPEGVHEVGGRWRVELPEDLDLLVTQLQDVLGGRSGP
jgi:hypothetical protein